MLATDDVIASWTAPTGPMTVARLPSGSARRTPGTCVGFLDPSDGSHRGAGVDRSPPPTRSQPVDAQMAVIDQPEAVRGRHERDLGNSEFVTSPTAKHEPADLLPVVHACRGMS